MTTAASSQPGHGTVGVSQVKLDISRPCRPTDNAYMESFNGTLRAECLDAHWFQDLTEADASKLGAGSSRRTVSSVGSQQ